MIDYQAMTKQQMFDFLMSRYEEQAEEVAVMIMAEIVKYPHETDFILQSLFLHGIGLGLREAQRDHDRAN